MPIDVRLLEKTFSSIEEVEQVHLFEEGSTIRVYTVVDDIENESTYDLIYDGEAEIMRRTEGVRFDFNVITRKGRDISELIGQHAPTWQRFPVNTPCHSGMNT